VTTPPPGRPPGSRVSPAPGRQPGSGVSRSPGRRPGPGVSPAVDVKKVPIEEHQTYIREGPVRAPAAGRASSAESGPSLAEICVVACAEAWRGDGAILASPMGLIPTLGARLAQLTFSPGLLLTDGEAYLLARPDADGAGRVIEGWLPYRSVFTMVAGGLRHVMMGAAQIDRFGNQNISCIGDWARPRAQLLGVRGAPGNTINHPVSYWVPKHSPRVFVGRVDMVSGVGYDRAAGLGPQAARFHELRVVVTNLAVLDFQTADRTMRLRSVHPGATAGDVIAATGFPLAVPDEVPATRLPTVPELALIRGQLDPGGRRDRELP
jgi:acyl CoA:acetate/3-ketoacid CoA transferase beta subunit